MEESERRLEAILEQIEFPGEDETRIGAYLRHARLAERVMERIGSARIGLGRAVMWGAFSLANTVLLVLMGTNRIILEGFLSSQEALCSFFFLFLGMTFLGSLVGLVFTLDTSWFTHLLVGRRH